MMATISINGTAIIQSAVTGFIGCPFPCVLKSRIQIIVKPIKVLPASPMKTLYLRFVTESLSLIIDKAKSRQLGQNSNMPYPSDHHGTLKYQWQRKETIDNPPNKSIDTINHIKGINNCYCRKYGNNQPNRAKC